MLVPNPSSVAKAQIGNRDFDLVSELSERQSVGSFEISSSSEDDFEEDGEEGLEEDERDQEYTIYSVLPNRQLEVVNKLAAKSHQSSNRSEGLEGFNMRPNKRGDLGEGRSREGE